MRHRNFFMPSQVGSFSGGTRSTQERSDSAVTPSTRAFWPSFTTAEEISDTTDTKCTPTDFRYHWLESNAFTMPERPNGDRSIRFAKLLETIRRMARLPEHDDFYIDAKTAANSEAIVAVLWNNFELDAPKMFPHEGDSLVLTWDSTVLKRLLTIADEDLDLLEMNKKSKVRCEQELSFKSPDDLKNWIMQLGGLPSAKSDISAADVP
ncbi:hypothetical protein AB6802_09495 [Mesorhizobium sp. RCC_202]|uniref:hypothetical protein n=1 Tax=Mesorhizobium sp. RCC_202 TaxID=3239222 RepID=UPI0035238068